MCGVITKLCEGVLLKVQKVLPSAYMNAVDRSFPSRHKMYLRKTLKRMKGCVRGFMTGWMNVSDCFYHLSISTGSRRSLITRCNTTDRFLPCSGCVGMKGCVSITSGFVSDRMYY